MNAPGVKASREMAPDGLDLRCRLLFHLRVSRRTTVLALLATSLLSTGASADATGPATDQEPPGRLC